MGIYRKGGKFPYWSTTQKRNSSQQQFRKSSEPTNQVRRECRPGVQHKIETTYKYEKNLLLFQAPSSASIQIKILSAFLVRQK